jgi:hypothetical protein
MMNRSFLLEKSHDVSVVANEFWSYDHQLEVNTIFFNKKTTPACTVSTMITGSKTEAAPGDDDPDPDVEFMY